MSTDETVKGSSPTGISIAFGSLSKGLQVVLGFLLGIAINLAVIFGTNWWLSGDIFYSSGPRMVFYFFYFLGATQLIWQLPLILLLRKKHNHVALGVLAAAVTTAVLITFFGRLETRV
ncbi:MAG TPA: hypothetical protein VK699_07920 [Terriglobales bacterium]|jgi:hypothetical protein|nr:hypothetical protein [Terriglobales bacterium]